MALDAAQKNQQGPKERGSFFSYHDVCYPAFSEWWSWSDPLVLLGVLWLNGNVDFPLLGFLTLGLVFGAPKGGSLGHMTPPTYFYFGDISSSYEALASLPSHLRHPPSPSTA